MNWAEIPGRDSCRCVMANKNCAALGQTLIADAAGSKIKFTSIIHMSWELVAIMLGYSLKVWEIRVLESLQKKQT